MLKHLRIKMMLLLCALIVGNASVWAEKSYTLTFKDSGTTNDGSNAYGKTVSAVLSEGSDYVSSISALAQVYAARTGRGAKFGSSSKAGSITFALSEAGKVKATKVVIKGGAYIASSKAEASSVKVNDGTAVAFDQTVTSYTEEDITYTFDTATEIETLKLEQVTAKNGRFYVVSVTVYYEDESGDTRETASWSLNPTSATVEEGSSTTLQLTTNYDGTLNFASANTSVATVSYNATTKVITVNGVAPGTTKINVTGDATTTYKALSKTIDVTVTVAELAYNLMDEITEMGYTYFGLTPEGSNAYAQPDVTETTKTDNKGVTIAFARAGSSNTKPRFDDLYTRFYKNNTLTITAPTGSKITKVVFTEPAKNKGWDGSMSVEEGYYDNDAKTWYATDAAVQSIVFTGITGTNRIGGIQVYLIVESLQATIGDALYATWIPTMNVEVPNGVSAYIATSVSSSSVVLGELLAIPAGTPVILNVETANTYTFAVCDDDDLEVNDVDVTTNQLKVSDGTTAVGSDIYVLAKRNDEVGFYRWTSASSLSEGKVYLKIAEGGSRLSILFDDVTGISAAPREMTNDNVYDLQGRRMASSTLKKGLYVVRSKGENGKKMIIK